MKLLEHINERHPLATGLLGAASGFAGWFLDHVEGITSVATCIGAVAGALAALITVGLKVREWLQMTRDRIRAETAAEFAALQKRDQEEDDLP